MTVVKPATAKAVKAAMARAEKMVKAAKAEKTVTTTDRLSPAPYSFASVSMLRTPSASRLTSLPGMIKR